jgi:hypothetical protein
MRNINWNKVYATVGVIASVAYGVSLVGINASEKPVTVGSGVCQVVSYEPAVKQQYAGKGQFPGPSFSVAETRECGFVKMLGNREPLVVGETYRMTWTDNPNTLDSSNGRILTSFSR